MENKERTSRESSQDYRKTLEQLRQQEGNRYKQTLAKVRNGALSHQSAWDTAQPVLLDQVEGWPDQYSDCLPALRAIFDLRREIYISHDQKRPLSDSMTSALREAHRSIDPTAQAQCLKPILFITEFVFHIDDGQKVKGQK